MSIMKSWMPLVAAGLLVSPLGAEPPEGPPAIRIADRQNPPAWALKQWLLIETQNRAVEKFYAHYFDDRGWYKGHLTWGIGIGSDDIMQGLANWRLFYALGGWHFDPEANRPGIPPDVAALVDKITRSTVGIHLVNVSQTTPRTVVVQTGAYGEHQCLQVTHNGERTEVNNHYFFVHLAPGSGGHLELKVKRFANRPRARMPWQP